MAFPVPDRVDPLRHSSDSGEPIAAVGEPPTERENGERSSYGPPKRQEKIGDKTNSRKGDPKDLTLHRNSLAPIGPDQSDTLAIVAQVGYKVGPDGPVLCRGL